MDFPGFYVVLYDSLCSLSEEVTGKALGLM